MVLKEPAEFNYQTTFQEVNPQFKATDIGEIPEEWNVAPLNTISNVIDSLHQTPEFSELGFPMVRVADLKGGYLDFKNAVRVSEEVYKKFTMGYSPQKGDIILSRVGSYGLIAYVDTDEKFCLGQNTAIINPKINSQYLFYSLQSDIVKKQIDNQVDGSTQKTLSLKNIKSLRIAVPSVPEQKKIAEILSSVDEAIASTQAVIDQTRKVKQGLLQQLLTRGIGHTKFKESAIGEIPEEWEVSQLGSTLDSIDAGWSPNCPDYPPEVGDWGVLKVSAVTRGAFLEEESKALSQNLEPRASIQVHQGDILMARANGVAELVGQAVQVRQEPSRKLMLSDKTLRLVPNPNRIDSELLTHLLSSALIREQIGMFWGGSSGQKNIAQAQIRQLMIPLPSITEQRKIADILESFVLNDEQLKAELITLEQMKRGLMQKLLTGRIRVKDTSSV